MGIKMYKTELFPYIDGSSLIGIRVNLTMDKVTAEKLPNGHGGEEMKYVLHFQDNKKSLVLNKTNVKRIIKVTGSDDTDDWRGKQICVFSEKVKAFGETHDAVRVGPPDPKAIQPGNGKKKPPPRPLVSEYSTDEVNDALFGNGAQSSLIPTEGGAYSE